MAKRSQDDDAPKDFQFLQQDASEATPSDGAPVPPDFSNVVAANSVPYLPQQDEKLEEAESLPFVTTDSPNNQSGASAIELSSSEDPPPPTSPVVQNKAPSTSRPGQRPQPAASKLAHEEFDSGFTPANESALSLAKTSRQPSAILTGYAVAVTMILLFLVLTGKVSLFGTHPLESLPDIKPLAPNEFKRVPENAALPEGHVLKLGESKRFGDVVVTPVKVTMEPLTFEEFRTATAAPDLATEPVLRLWIQFKNVAEDYAFAPFDADLMSSRFPQLAVDENAQVNSFLRLEQGDQNARVLNYLQTSDSNFVLSGQNSGKLIAPGEELLTFVASEETLPALAESTDAAALWRVQFRKGVNVDSGNGVTTLIDVPFSVADVNATPIASTAP